MVRLTGTEADTAVIREAGEALRRGELVAFPTETVYGLGGNGLDAASSAKIYAAKGRPSDNPLILHIAEREELAPLVTEIPPAAKVLADRFWPGPMTLIFRKSALVPKETTGGLDTVAVRMPSHPAARALIRAAGVPVAAPSANLSGRPSPTEADRVREDLDGRIAWILDGGPSEIGLESTIIDLTGPAPVVLRPGYIGLSALRELFPEASLDPAVSAPPREDLRPKAPGMKYRHYAPKGRMTLVKGSPEAAAVYIRREALALRAQGKKPGVLCGEESEGRYEGLLTVSLGKTEGGAEPAHRLYEALRRMDDLGVTDIFSECFDGGPLGEALMNRLTKAAGYHIVQAEEETKMIAIGCDHGGFELKQEILRHLEKRGLAYRDFGCYGTASCDYPVYGRAVAEAVAGGECERGILICGTGIGISITANKVKGIRAALCTDCFMAEATRLHNDANILALGGRVVGPGLALKIVDTFLDTPFSGEERHVRRISQIEPEEADE